MQTLRRAWLLHVGLALGLFARAARGDEESAPPPLNGDPPVMRLPDTLDKSSPAHETPAVTWEATWTFPTGVRIIRVRDCRSGRKSLVTDAGPWSSKPSQGWLSRLRQWLKGPQVPARPEPAGIACADALEMIDGWPPAHTVIPKSNGHTEDMPFELPPPKPLHTVPGVWVPADALDRARVRPDAQGMTVHLAGWAGKSPVPLISVADLMPERTQAESLPLPPIPVEAPSGAEESTAITIARPSGLAESARGFSWMERGDTFGAEDPTPTSAEAKPRSRNKTLVIVLGIGSIVALLLGRRHRIRRETT